MKDEVFSQKAMGDGIAMASKDGKIYAPFDGEVQMFFETGHAIGLKSNDGAEVLIHVGIDTVKLGGDGFSPKVKVGDSVSKGQLLLEFDKKSLEGKGFDTTIPVNVTNTQNYKNVLGVAIGNVSTKQVILQLDSI